jgi:hypothetical protein
VVDLIVDLAVSLRKSEEACSENRQIVTVDVYGHLFPGGDHHSKFAAGTAYLWPT